MTGVSKDAPSVYLGFLNRRPRGMECRETTRTKSFRFLALGFPVDRWQRMHFRFYKLHPWWEHPV